jgi:hypothetical protein
VIVAGSTVSLTAVQQATKAIPIVFVSVADPLTQRFVPNMRQSSANGDPDCNFRDEFLSERRPLPASRNALDLPSPTLGAPASILGIDEPKA